MNRASKFEKFAWAFLGYLLVVILFGAWVRITHSGAGCGSHWPTCHGEIIPIAPTTETMIEFTHRLTSGLLGIIGLVLIGWAYRVNKFGRVFKAAVVTMVLIIFEALIGAGLVLKELVADDDSVARAVVIAIHLANTLILTASASLVAWWARERPAFSLAANRGPALLVGFGLFLLVVTSMTGAVTALGDTLFPVDPTIGDGLMTRVREDLSAANHFLVRLRIVHPIVAIGSAMYLLGLSVVLRSRHLSASAHRWATVMFVLVIMQTVLGFVNVGLAAPGWMQLVHLFMAQALWIATVITLVGVAQDD